MSVAVLMLILIHWSLIAASYFHAEWREFFVYVFFYPSPIAQFFTLLKQLGLEWSGRYSPIFLPFFLYNLVKYFMLIRSLIVEGLNGITSTALLLEIAYIGLVAYYIVYFSYL